MTAWSLPWVFHKRKLFLEPTTLWYTLLLTAIVVCIHVHTYWHSWPYVHERSWAYLLELLICQGLFKGRHHSGSAFCLHAVIRIAWAGNGGLGLVLSLHAYKLTYIIHPCTPMHTLHSELWSTPHSERQQNHNYLQLYIGRLTARARLQKCSHISMLTWWNVDPRSQ